MKRRWNPRPVGTLDLHCQFLEAQIFWPRLTEGLWASLPDTCPCFKPHGSEPAPKWNLFN